MSLTERVLDLSNKDKKIRLDNLYYLIDDGVEFQALELKGSNLDKVIVAIDHDTPTSSPEASERQKKLIQMAEKFNLRLDNGIGIGVQLLSEGQVSSGDIVLGCGYDICSLGANQALGFRVDPEELIEAINKGYIEIDVPEVVFIELNGKLTEDISSKDLALKIIKDLNSKGVKGKIIEFYGDGVSNLSKDDHVTLCSLMGKTNALSAIINLSNDISSATLQYDLSEIKSMVVLPDSYKKIVNIDDLENEIKVVEVFIGGNSGGKIEDLRNAAEILKGKKISHGLRIIIAPVTSSVYLQMAGEGLLEIFIDAGCVIMNQGYSVDFGKSQGILDAGEVLVSAGDNNDKEMLGGKDSKIYIVSPRVAAQTALTGFLGKNI